ncbi:MAG: PEP-CTERM sorting domain-containing protein [Verrucomicrobiales bacterium]
MKSTLLSLISLASLAQAQASVHITWEQVGEEVRVAYSGSIDTTGITYSGTGGIGIPNNVTAGDDNFYVLNLVSTDYLYFSGGNSVSTGLASYDKDIIGTPTLLIPESADSFGFWPGFLFLPYEYNSGDPISGWVLLPDISLADLNAENFNNTLAWDDGGANQIYYTTIPEPGSAALLGLTALGFIHRKRSCS